MRVPGAGHHQALKGQPDGLRSKEAQGGLVGKSLKPEGDIMQAVNQRRSVDHPSHARTYDGRCFCGAVQITVQGEPVAMGYCHCESCRCWSASPVNAFTLWNPDAVEVTGGKSNIGVCNKTSRSFRKWCKSCGGHLFTEHPEMGLIDVYAATIPDFPFHAQVHVNYQETKLRIRDGLPKLKDFPKEMGGSGMALPE
jgi:hypothetical protein